MQINLAKELSGYFTSFDKWASAIEKELKTLQKESSKKYQQSLKRKIYDRRKQFH